MTFNDYQPIYIKVDYTSHEQSTKSALNIKCAYLHKDNGQCKDGTKRLKVDKSTHFFFHFWHLVHTPQYNENYIASFGQPRMSAFHHIAHSHENGSSRGFFVLWSNNPCSLHKICNRVNFLLDLDKIYTDIYSFLYFWLQIHTTFAPQSPKNT